MMSFFDNLLLDVSALSPLKYELWVWSTGNWVWSIGVRVWSIDWSESTDAWVWSVGVWVWSIGPTGAGQSLMTCIWVWSCVA